LDKVLFLSVAEIPIALPLRHDGAPAFLWIYAGEDVLAFRTILEQKI